SLVLLNMGSLTAQTFFGGTSRFNREKINPFPENTNRISSANDTIRILGIMVNFQEDRDGATFGNGKFGSIYSQNYGNSILDPLPHDKSYFESHLEFVKNYFSKVSRGQVHIEYFILPDTFSVSQTMRNYAPEPGSDNFTPTGNFAKEVWTTASSMYPGFNFSEYDIFTIFHAGVGRDVSLPGSLGNERDLPSVYLGDKALREIFNNDLTGFPINRDVEYNSMIIPETESREVSTFGGTVLFQLSINGLLAASVASHLGLPDLFNTETGLSAIGRFGLMDGQAIFAYSGTFPPEPSAWEKIYLGLDEPVTIEPGDFNINIITKNAASIGDTVILKVPINSSEYFLVENRIRDANSNGATVTYIVNGETRTKNFTKDTTGFQSFAVDSIPGVVIDVDEFDWAIPNTRSVGDDIYDPIPGGGIVIWHIDEKVISEKLEENKINVDKDNRGVDVEEADGVQDIGERFFTVFGDEIIGEGFVEDSWYANNPADLFENRFSKDTRPNTNTNSDANSLITFSNFSPKNNRMSFNLSYGDSVIKPIISSQLPFQSTENKLNLFQNGNDFAFYLTSDGNLYRVNNLGDVTDTSFNFSQFKTASTFFIGAEFVVGAYHIFLNVYANDGVLSDSTSVNVGENITASPVLRITATEQRQILVGTERGKILTYALESRPPSNPSFVSSFEVDTSLIIKKVATNGSYFSFIAQSKILTIPLSPFPLFQDSNGKTFSFTSEEPIDIAITKNKNGEDVSIVLTYRNKFYVIKDGNLLSEFEINTSEQIKSFALADLKQDGENYIVFNNGDKLEAVNLEGASAENFPFTDPLELGFAGTPVAADFEGTANSEIISLTIDGRIFAVDGATGRLVNGFPLSIGSQSSSTPVIFNDRGKISLAALNSENNFYEWNIGSTLGKVEWAEENGNNQNTTFLGAASSANFVNEFLPGSRVYNYPNPVYENTTLIRYYVSEDAKVNIKIFDLAGGLVDELNDNALGGFDNETEWSVNDIQSGVYLARVEATGTSGKSENKIIKIAVIK
ncbi:MAG: T9SS type A sorting domain-containing protein, partial [Ignavibacteria bacterium]|nr:T9SS type A sorting domain-containing protein [Ignavibacteria bacterium]